MQTLENISKSVILVKLFVVVHFSDATFKIQFQSILKLFSNQLCYVPVIDLRIDCA